MLFRPRGTNTTVISAAGRSGETRPVARGRRLLASQGLGPDFQVHYHPDGKPATDRSRIGLHFATTPIRQTVHRPFALNAGLLFLPGKSNIEVKATWTVPVIDPGGALAVTPHMHKVGRDMTMMVTYPDGRTDDLIKIADWDFGWQNTYFFETPFDLPRGSVLRVVAHYAQFIEK